MTSVGFEHRRGMALLVVVVLTMLIALAAYRFSFYMESQYRLTRLNEEQVHARLAALSGIEMGAAMAELSTAEQVASGGLFDNRILQHIPVTSNVSTTSTARSEESIIDWRCSLVSPAVDGLGTSSYAVGDASDLRFGLENESAKIHMPTLLEWDRKQPGHARTSLLNLPGATETLVDSWLRGLGASGAAGNGGGSSLIDRLQTDNSAGTQQSATDQLRLLWYGGDLNQNYRLDALEKRLSDQLLGAIGSANTNTLQNANVAADPLPAWQRLVTWHSGHRNETFTGQPRIYLNEPNLQQLHQQLSTIWPADWANFVIVLRQYGPNEFQYAPSGNSQLSLSASNATTNAATNQQVESPAPDFSKPSSYTLSSVLDLVGAVVEAPPSVTSDQSTAIDGKLSSSSKRKQTLRNPFSSDLSEARNYLGRVLDESTVDANSFVTGRIDLSAAPAVVLASVPGVDIALAQRIVQQRETKNSVATESVQVIASLLESGILDLVKLKAILPYLSIRNDVYTVQAVGYRDQLSPVYRCTVTIDARRIPARTINHQIWHPWDRGFTIDQLDSASQ